MGTTSAVVLLRSVRRLLVTANAALSSSISILMIEEQRSSETSVLTRDTRHLVQSVV
jgi:hypothetical protein